VLRFCQRRNLVLSAYVSIRQHTSAYVSVRQRTSAPQSRSVSIRQDVSMRQHASAYVSMRQHTSAYVSIRQHTSAYVSIRQHTSACAIYTQLGGFAYVSTAFSSCNTSPALIEPLQSLESALIGPHVRFWMQLPQLPRVLSSARIFIKALLRLC
jgi:hypothetical protein